WTRQRWIARVLRIATPTQVQTRRRKSRQTAAAAPIFARKRPVLREQQVRDAHLHVVGFTRKDVQRLVLCLPAETADRAIVAVVVERPGNTQTIVEVLGHIR